MPTGRTLKSKIAVLCWYVGTRRVRDEKNETLPEPGPTLESEAI
jgi:hypothetical protein